MIIHSGTMRLLTAENTPLGNISFREFAVGVKIYPETISLGASLQETNILDEFNQDTQFPNIVTPIEKEERLFDLLVKYKPYDIPGVDIYVYMQTRPLQIIYNKTWIDHIGRTSDLMFSKYFQFPFLRRAMLPLLPRRELRKSKICKKSTLGA